MRHFGSGAEGRNVWLVDEGDGLVATTTQPWPLDGPQVLRTFHGGHVAEEVTDAEKVALEAAGFTVDEVA